MFIIMEKNTKVIYSTTSPRVCDLGGHNRQLRTASLQKASIGQTIAELCTQIIHDPLRSCGERGRQLFRALAPLLNEQGCSFFLKRFKTKKICGGTSLHTNTYDRLQCTAPHYHLSHLFCASSFPSFFTHLRATPQPCAAHPSPGRVPIPLPLPLPCVLRSRRHG
jgi:hypothetical protein